MYFCSTVLTASQFFIRDKMGLSGRDSKLFSGIEYSLKVIIWILLSVVS
jgi:tetrahydromethanopterin S-methyltransferase subunit F